MPDDGSPVIYPAARGLIRTGSIQLIERSVSRQQKPMLVVGGIPEMPGNVSKVIESLKPRCRLPFR